MNQTEAHECAFGDVFDALESDGQPYRHNP